MVVAIAGAQGRQPQGSALRLLVPQVTRGFHTMVTGNYGAAAPIILDMRYAVALGARQSSCLGSRQICNQLQSGAGTAGAPTRTDPARWPTGWVYRRWSMATNASRSARPPAPRRERAHSGAELSPRSADSRSRGADRSDPALSVDLPLALPVTDAEVRLVAAYLGDLIHQILSEPQ